MKRVPPVRDWMENSDILNDFDIIYESHKKRYGKRKMKDKELKKFLNLNT